MVDNITASSYLGFNNEELPSDGQANNKALHISMKFLDTILSRVLVDIDLSLKCYA